MINQYRVFQIKEVHHQHWAKSYAQQVEDGFLIHHQNYHSAYKGKPAPSDTPMTARKRLEEKRPNTFIGRSFGVGDVIVWDEEKERKFFYVNKEELIEFGGFMDADAAGNTVVYMVPNYQIDGKSLLGLMSVKLGLPMRVVISGSDEELAEQYLGKYEFE